jgi:hypothetical protein
MTIQDSLNQFVEEQKANNVSNEDINQTVQIAFVTVLAKTFEDLKSVLSEEELKQMTGKFTNPEQINDEAFMNELANNIITPTGVSFKTLLEENFAKFFNDLRAKLEEKEAAA